MQIKITVDEQLHTEKDWRCPWHMVIPQTEVDSRLRFIHVYIHLRPRPELSATAQTELFWTIVRLVHSSMGCPQPLMIPEKTSDLYPTPSVVPFFFFWMIPYQAWLGEQYYIPATFKISHRSPAQGAGCLELCFQIFLGIRASFIHSAKPLSADILSSMFQVLLFWRCILA